jgi:segregation and condensation protein A
MPYEVKLTVFEGPLDLLLQLIERRELDITTVSLAAVTDQYLDYIGILANVEPDVLADFLVIAARLILIKSQALLPRPPEPEEQEEDLGQDLVRQLQEYRRFKEIAILLKDRDEQGLHSYIRLATTGITPRVQLEGVVLADLVEAMRRVLTTLPEELTVPDLPRPQFTIAEKISVIENAISAGRASFRSMLSEIRTRGEAIVMFLALLEMIKQQRVRVEQEQVFGEIMVVAGNGNGSVATARPEPPPQ